MDIMKKGHKGGWYIITGGDVGEGNRGEKKKNARFLKESIQKELIVTVFFF